MDIFPNCRFWWSGYSGGMKFGLGLFLWVFWVEQGMKKGVVCIFFLLVFVTLKWFIYRRATKAHKTPVAKVQQTLNLLWNQRLQGVHSLKYSCQCMTWMIWIPAFRKLFVSSKLFQRNPLSKETWTNKACSQRWPKSSFMRFLQSFLLLYSLTATEATENRSVHNCFMPALPWPLHMKFALRSCVSTGRNWCDCSSSLPSLL